MFIRVKGSVSKLYSDILAQILKSILGPGVIFLLGWYSGKYTSLTILNHKYFEYFVSFSLFHQNNVGDIEMDQIYYMNYKEYILAAGAVLNYMHIRFRNNPIPKISKKIKNRFDLPWIKIWVADYIAMKFTRHCWCLNFELK